MTRAVGIDLGTTHCALAYAENGKITVLDVPQLVGNRLVEARPLLPSFLYLPHSSEGAMALPWDDQRRFAVGEFARERAAEAPGRVVSSAKSWLCHPRVDRRAALLPPGGPAAAGGSEDVDKVSPVEASWRYLEHLSEAFDATIARSDEAARLASQSIVLTVPASFDAAARELTVEAAFAAGLEGVTLLEEPQAALYAWLHAQGEGWRKQLEPGDVILVIDVGGGTTDFSAIVATDDQGTLALERVAVGDHILLGGDNMDLALMHLLKARIESEGKAVDAAQAAALAFACRAAKERLLSDESIASVPIAVAGRGSRLLGSSLRADLLRADVEQSLLEGFFPVVAKDAAPTTRARSALTQLGLPYASDPAITRHLAHFLTRQAAALTEQAGQRRTMLHPTCVLFNGGVMKSARLRGRLLEVLGDWMKQDGAPAPRELPGADYDLAVARGAVAYALAKEGKLLRIRGGTARSYYVGIEEAAPAVPGVEPPLTALCVAPFGMEEGSSVELPGDLGLVVGERVTFRFFGSSVRRDDRAGTSLERWKPDELEELAPIEVTVAAKPGEAEGSVLPVRLRAEVTAIGTLKLEARASGDEHFTVELNVRGSPAPRLPP